MDDAGGRGPGRTRGMSRGMPARGLYGGRISGQNMLRAAVVELVGTFILVFTGHRRRHRGPPEACHGGAF